MVLTNSHHVPTGLEALKLLDFSFADLFQSKLNLQSLNIAPQILFKVMNEV